MARKPHTPSQDVIDILDTPDAAAASAALNTLSQSARDIMATYKLASANPDVLVAEIHGFQASAVDAMFNIGVRLMLLRQITPTGEWLKRLEQVGINERAAQRIVQATLKYSDPRKQRSEKLLAIGKSKLIELLVLDDDSIDALDADGELGELDLDDIARMSVTELRAALREAQADLEAKDLLVESKNKKIDDLDVKLKSARKFKPSPDSEAHTAQEQTQLDEIAAAVRECELAFNRLAIITADIFDNCANESIRMRSAQGLQYIVARCRECTEEHGLAKQHSDHVPDWLKPNA